MHRGEKRLGGEEHTLTHEKRKKKHSRVSPASHLAPHGPEKFGRLRAHRAARRPRGHAPSRSVRMPRGGRGELKERVRVSERGGLQLQGQSCFVKEPQQRGECRAQFPGVRWEQQLVKCAACNSQSSVALEEGGPFLGVPAASQERVFRSAQFAAVHAERGGGQPEEMKLLLGEGAVRAQTSEQAAFGAGE